MSFRVETSTVIPFRVQDLMNTGDAYEILPGGALEITKDGRRILVIESTHWSWIEELGD